MKKNVQFSDYDDIFEIPHINNMSREEIQDCWMTDQDFKNIRLECRHAVKAFDNALKHTHLPEGYYLRGLDQQTMVSCEFAGQ